MLIKATQVLLRDAFEHEDFFRDLSPIRKRVVAWGPHAQPLALSHSAIVVSEDILLERLRRKALFDDRLASAEAEWMIVASRPLPSGSVEHHFGSRMATGVAVRLKDQADAAACWVESLESGWLFLIPVASAPAGFSR